MTHRQNEVSSAAAALVAAVREAHRNPVKCSSALRRQIAELPGVWKAIDHLCDAVDQAIETQRRIACESLIEAAGSNASVEQVLADPCLQLVLVRSAEYHGATARRIAEEAIKVLS